MLTADESKRRKEKEKLQAAVFIRLLVGGIRAAVGGTLCL